MTDLTERTALEPRWKCLEPRWAIFEPALEPRWNRAGQDTPNLANRAGTALEPRLACARGNVVRHYIGGAAFANAAAPPPLWKGYP